MPRDLVHSVATSLILGAVATAGMAVSGGRAAPVSDSPLTDSALSGGFVVPLAAEQSRQVTRVRSLEGIQLAQAGGSSAPDPNQPSSIPSASARGPIGSQGTGGDSLNMPTGMAGGMRSEEGMQSGRVPSQEMMNRSQAYPAERQSGTGLQQEQQRAPTWWNPLTWGRGMRSQEQLREERQELPSSGAATRNPRYENETVVEQPWRAPDVPGGRRGQTSTGRESRPFGGTPAQSNPGMGSDYFGRQQQPRPMEQQQ